MSDNRNAMLDILAETQKLMHQRRVQGLIRSSTPSGASTPAQSPMGGALATTGGFNTSDTGILVAGGRPPIVKSMNYIGARENRGDFFDVWSRRIEAFVNDSTLTALDLPAELDSNDRRVLHTLADKFNLAHTSLGKGQERHLVLKKDALFYRAATKVVDHAAIEALKNKKEAAHGSRFHLRRAQNESADAPLPRITDGGDEDGEEASGKEARLQKALRLLDRATDQFAFATDASGASAPSAILNGPNAPFESEANKYLSQNRNNNAVPTGSSAASTPALTEVPSQWASAMQEHKKAPITQCSIPAAVMKDIITREEQCTRCGTSTVMDYDVGQWTCVGMCETCKRESVFRLVERKRRVVVAAETPAADSPSLGAKRAREEGEEALERQQAEAEEKRVEAEPTTSVEAVTKAAEAPITAVAKTAKEEIEKESDDTANDGEDEDELIPLETDDLTAMLECNDHDASFITWCRNFANESLNGDADAIGARILFVMELSDIPSKGPRDTAVAATSPAARHYCKLTDSPSAIAALVDDVWTSVFAKSSDVVLGLPNMSVSGINVEVVMHGPAGADAEGAFAAIKSKVGGSRLVYGDSLKAVLQ